MTAVGTVLGIAAVVATVGLTQSAENAVSSAFNAELATQVSFQEVSDISGSTVSGGNLLSEGSEPSLLNLKGVINAGLIIQVNGNNPMNVSRSPLGGGGQDSVNLPLTAATPGALATMHAHVSYGRLYDKGFEKRHEMVAILGAPAAAELGITRTDGSQAIFVDSVPLTVIGIVNHVAQQSQALLGVIVPPDVANSLSANVGAPTMIVQTAEGAAQTVGREGPYVLDPSHPSAIVAQVPPDPKTLRQHVEGSVSGLLLVLALVSFTIGIVAIGNISLLSVVQRTSEIGLRRALGARPHHVALLIIIEAIFIGLVGAVLGCSAGILVTSIVSVARGWTPVLSWQIVVVAPVLGALAGILAGLYPARRASRLSPVEALQSM